MANVTWIRRAAADAPRSKPRRERVSIDLRKYEAALNAIAQAQHTSVAALVRTPEFNFEVQDR